VFFSRDPDRVAITWSGKSEGAVQEKAPLQEETFPRVSGDPSTRFCSVRIIVRTVSTYQENY